MKGKESRLKMRNRFGRMVLIQVLLYAVLLVAGCQKSEVPPEGGGTHLAAQSVATEEGGQGAVPLIKALGILRPAETRQLSFSVGGPVRAVIAYLGMEVKAGDLLAELDTTALGFELEKARTSVALRQVALDGLLNGPNSALAERAELEHAQQVAEAEIALQMALWRLEEMHIQDQIEGQANALEIAQVQARNEQLDLQLAQARVLSPTVEVLAAQVNLARVQDALDTARLEYEKALDRPWEPQEVRDAYAKAVWHAEQELELARARLAEALDAQSAHVFGVEALDAQREAAAIQLTQTMEAQLPNTVTFALLEAQVELAQLQLDGLLAWQNLYLDPPPTHEIAQARALLRQAELTVEELEWQLEGAQLRAPFDGVVSAVFLRAGEWAAAGTPVVELLNTTGWLVETRNVGELNIGQMRVGQEALVRVNAFPGEALRGRVATISPVAVVQQGDTTYTLTIELEPTDLNLRPGMTVQVEILTQPSGDGG